MIRPTLSFAFLGLLVISSACATTTSIKTEPEGGVVFDDNGSELGATPYEYTSSSWKTTQDKLIVKKPGYKTQTVSLERSEVAVGGMIGGIVMIACGVPMLSTVVVGAGLIGGGIAVILAGGFNYPEETLVVMAPESGSAPDPTPPPVEPAIKEEEQPLSMVY